MANQWYNEDGLAIRYGTDQAAPEQPTAAQVLKFGSKRQLVQDFTYDNLPDVSVDENNDGTNDAYGSWDAKVPAHAYITAAYLVVTEAFAGGTSYNIGLYQKDNTVIDADGLDAAVGVAALADNRVVNMDGALVGGTANIGDNDGYIKIAATGTFTAGAARLVVEYIEPAEKS